MGPKMLRITSREGPKIPVASNPKNINPFRELQTLRGFSNPLLSTIDSSELLNFCFFDIKLRTSLKQRFQEKLSHPVETFGIRKIEFICDAARVGWEFTKD